MPEEREEIEISEERKDVAWEAGFSGKDFPSFGDEISDKELKALKWLYGLARADGLVDVKMQFGANTGTSAKDYEIEREIGHGTFGTVYLAKETSVDKWVAIKIAKEALTSESDIKRSETEGRAGANIDSPYVVSTHRRKSLDDGKMYIVMDYVKGAPLTKYIREGKPLEKSLILQACKWLQQVCEALKAAGEHKEGAIAHRDLKPGNILIDKKTLEVRICDFGLATFTASENSPTGVSSGKANMGGTQGMIGTWGYVAPEQARDARKANQQSDMYSVGATFYHLFTGKLPTGNRKPVEIEQLHLAYKTPVPEVPHKWNPHLPAEISRLIMYFLEIDQANRPHNFVEVLEKSVGEDSRHILHPEFFTATGLTQIIADLEFEAEKERRKHGRRGGASKASDWIGIKPTVPSRKFVDFGKARVSASVSGKESHVKGESSTDSGTSPDKGDKMEMKEKPGRNAEPVNSGSEIVRLAKDFWEQGDQEGRETALRILDKKAKDAEGTESDKAEIIEVLLMRAELLLKVDDYAGDDDPDIDRNGK